MLFVVCIVLSSRSAIADENEMYYYRDVPKFNQLRTADSPAFVIMDVSPTEIQRPNSIKDLSITVGNTFVKGAQGMIPKNLSLELSPYWLSDRRNMTYTDYVDAGIIERMVQNLTISIGATSDVYKDEKTQEELRTTYMAVGVRTTIYEKRKYIGYEKDLSNTLEKWGNVVRKKKIDIIKEANKEGMNADEVKKMLDAVDAQIKNRSMDGPLNEVELESLKNIESSLRNQILGRRGYALDGAAALSFGFKDAMTKEIEAEAFSTWFTNAYLYDNVSILGLTRYRVNMLEGDRNEHIIDLGIRGIYAFDIWALSAEGIFRIMREKDKKWNDDYRMDIGVDVAIGQELWLNITFGKNYRADDTGSLIGMVNVKWGFGDRWMRLNDDDAASVKK